MVKEASQIHAAIKPKQSEYYWLNAPGIDPDEPLCIGQFSKSFSGPNGWYIWGEFYTDGVGIKIIKKISRPKI